MKNLSILAAVVAIVAVMSAPLADAKNEAGDKKRNDAIQDRVQDVADRAEMERDQVKRRDKKKKDRIQDAMDDERSDHDPDDHDLEDHDSDHDIGRGESAQGRDNAANRGNEKSQEMRARSDERKAIKEEYKANGRGEAVEVGSAVDALDADADVAAEDSEKKDKKPWWKFWNQ